jgi:hypothetical protein
LCLIVLFGDGGPNLEMFAFGFLNLGRVLGLLPGIKDGQVVGSNAESIAIRQILNLFRR